jgi:hypothetical protein
MNIRKMKTLMISVYGNWDELIPKNLFPIPLPTHQAGASQVPYNKSECQRRYLWTDAFGVLNFLSLSKEAPDCSLELLEAAKLLIHAVHQTLGAPRDDRFPMCLRNGRFLGLRIGKVSARRGSDSGMQFDGMYWHYLDKWLFALARYYQFTEDDKILQEAIQLAKDVFSAFCERRSNRPLGLYWKMNADLTPIPALIGSCGPNSDAFSAITVFNILNDLSKGSLDQEVADLRYILNGYNEAPPFDPLGYGLLWWRLQWLDPNECADMKRELILISDQELDFEQGMRLPFRLFGAVLGAKLSGVPVLAKGAEEIVTALVEKEFDPTDDEHSSINSVMLASCINPLAFKKRPEEAFLKFT